MSKWHMHEANGSIHRDQPGLFGGTEDTCPTSPKRPVVVIDLEDAEQVNRLRLAVGKLGSFTSSDVIVRETQEALREFANPTPRIEEPTGLGAVVEDAEGRLWVRSPIVDDYCWNTQTQIGAGLLTTSWSEVKAVRVLSEGVPS